MASPREHGTKSGETSPWHEAGLPRTIARPKPPKPLSARLPRAGTPQDVLPITLESPAEICQRLIDMRMMPLGMHASSRTRAVHTCAVHKQRRIWKHVNQMA